MKSSALTEISKYEGQEVTTPGLGLQPHRQGQAVLPARPRRDGLRAVRGVQRRPCPGTLRANHAPAAGILGDHHGDRAGGQARARYPRWIRGRRQAT